jgi:hypothetical protein
MNKRITFTAPRYQYMAVAIFFLILCVLMAGSYTEWFTELPTFDGNFKRTIAIIGMPFSICFFIYSLIIVIRSPNKIEIFPENSDFFFDESKLSNVKNIKITQSAIGRYQVYIEISNDKKIKTAHYYKCNLSFEDLKSSFTGSRNTQILPSN